MGYDVESISKNMKSISRNSTYPQSWYLQANDSGWNAERI